MARKFPLHNLRQRIDGQWEQEYTEELFTVPPVSGGVCIYHLDEVPDNGQVNPTLELSGSPSLTSTTSYPPANGQYYVNFAMGRIAFNSAQEGVDYVAKYYKKGSLIEAEDINWLADRIQEDFNSSYIISSTEPPSGDVFAGQQWYNSVDGLTYIWDNHDRWISTNREVLVFGRAGSAGKPAQYLSYYISGLTSNNSGLRLLRNAYITGASVQLSNPATCTVEILRNQDELNPLYTFDGIELGSNGWDKNADLNIAVLDTDRIQVRISAPTPVQDPIVKIELAWRI